MNLNDGIFISSFIKDTDKIWEGIIYTRSDGQKVVLNETTKRWKKLSDLEYIKENFTPVADSNALMSFGKTDNKNIKYDDLKNEFSSKIVGEDPTKAIQNAESILTNKSAIAAGGKALFDRANTTLTDKREAPENLQTATDDFNTSMKDIAADAKAAETGDPEDGIEEVKKIANIKEYLHPSLRPYLKLEEFRSRDESKEWAFRKKQLEDIRKMAVEDKERFSDSIDYENEDYLDIPDDLKSEVMADIMTHISNNEEDIITKIKKEYELSDSDAEEFVIEAMDRYVKNSDVIPKDSIKDITDEEVENSFEQTIDNFDGPKEDLLDHLVDVYEIDTDKAEEIVDKTKGNLIETIFEFVDLVKLRLQESRKDRFIDKNKNFEYDWEKNQVKLWLQNPVYEREISSKVNNNWDLVLAWKYDDFEKIKNKIGLSKKEILDRQKQGNLKDIFVEDNTGKYYDLLCDKSDSMRIITELIREYKKIQDRSHTIESVKDLSGKHVDELINKYSEIIEVIGIDNLQCNIKSAEEVYNYEENNTK